MTDRIRRRRGFAVASLVAALGILSAGQPPAAQQRPEMREDGEAHPEAIGPFRTRVYKIRKKKLWRGLLKTLEEAGYPPEEVDEAARVVKTAFVDFDAKDFPEEVAEPPMRFGPNSHVIQLKKVRVGKVSIEAGVGRGEGGAELRIRARILVMGLDKRQRIRVLVDRRSTGVIEAAFLRRLEESLRIEPI
ncbi:MAG: hypothetical protein ACE5JH_11800 [Acidobacteriota bacterium]